MPAAVPPALPVLLSPVCPMSPLCPAHAWPCTEPGWVTQLPPPLPPPLGADGPTEAPPAPGERQCCRILQLFECKSDMDDLTLSPALLVTSLTPQPSATGQQTLFSPGARVTWTLFLPTGKRQAQCYSAASIMEQRCQTGTTKPMEILKSTADPSTSTSVWYRRHQL